MIAVQNLHATEHLVTLSTSLGQLRASKSQGNGKAGNSAGFQGPAASGQDRI